QHSEHGLKIDGGPGLLAASKICTCLPPPQQHEAQQLQRRTSVRHSVHIATPVGGDERTGQERYNLMVLDQPAADQQLVLVLEPCVVAVEQQACGSTPV